MAESETPARFEACEAARRAGGLAVKFSAGDRLYRPGDAARGWIVIERGRVRVSLVAESGREVLLYRIAAGESCVLTTSALLSAEALIAEAVAETEVEGRLIPAPAFERLLGESAEFRRIVLSNYAERVADLVVVMQEVLFRALPQRLARFLVARGADGVVAATHQAIAAELGTAREVVSRVLGRFERDGLIASERGAIRILDAAALRRAAAPAVV